MLVTDRRRFPTPKPDEAIARAEAEVIEEILGRGVEIVQLREKDLDGAALLRRALRLRQICDAHGARLVVNGRVDVAVAASADGVHLPVGGVSVPDARRLLPRGALVGCSVHHHEELSRVGDADYVIFGPIFETPSKPGYGPARGPAGLRAMVASAAMPVLAIGGIGPENAACVWEAGAAGIAMMGAPLANPACLDSLEFRKRRSLFNREA
ncbi:MAG TPA: thiamine phosphate synthase [Deltaproteobacteria bacterium]|nr:thiamine phosphate synthase [Deltaproteobacteria bacterium]